MLALPDAPRAADPAVAEAAELLAGGGVLALPTETVYGLCASLARPEAVARLWAIKGREERTPIAMLLPSAAEIVRWAEVPPWAQPLLAELLPGPLTVVLHPTRAETARLGSEETVGIRVPDHAIARALLEALGGPIAATSANRSGRPPLATAEEVVRDLGDEVDLVLTGGPAGAGVASTVADLTVFPPRILREGAIAGETILAYASSVSEISRLTDELE